MASLSLNDDGGSVRLRVGETVAIRLPENASTGYRWSLGDHDGDVVKLVSSEPVYPSGAVGSGGEMVFTFEATHPGKTPIRLVEGRAWEKGSEAKRFEVEIIVDDRAGTAG
jgi:inhibitor of cysteine peptidase